MVVSIQVINMLLMVEVINQLTPLAILMRVIILFQPSMVEVVSLQKILRLHKLQKSCQFS